MPPVAAMGTTRYLRSLCCDTVGSRKRVGSSYPLTIVNGDSLSSSSHQHRHHTTGRLHPSHRSSDGGVSSWSLRLSIVVTTSSISSRISPYTSGNFSWCSTMWSTASWSTWAIMVSSSGNTAGVSASARQDSLVQGPLSSGTATSLQQTSHASLWSK